MPIENERRYLLRDYDDLEIALKKMYFVPEIIQQGYLDVNTRIRRILDGDTTFTWKKRLSDGKTMEIETRISEIDFDLLFKECERHQTKRRYTFFHGSLRWDVDFHFDNTGVFFARAEVEMPAEMKEPPIPFWAIHPHIVAKVDLDDTRFSSYNICNKDYAINLAAQYNVKG